MPAMNTTAAGLVMIGISLAVGLAGAGFVTNARAVPAPEEPARRTLAGTVIEVLATPCFVRGNRAQQTCHRPVVAYTDGGAARQVAGRIAYHPAQHARGEPASVAVLSDGTAWIASELDQRLAEERGQHTRRQGFPQTMGWMLMGSGAIGGLLGLGLIFWVDRSGDAGANPVS